MSNARAWYGESLVEATERKRILPVWIMPSTGSPTCSLLWWCCWGCCWCWWWYQSTLYINYTGRVNLVSDWWFPSPMVGTWQTVSIWWWRQIKWQSKDPHLRWNSWLPRLARSCWPLSWRRTQSCGGTRSALVFSITGNLSVFFERSAVSSFLTVYSTPGRGRV